MITVTANKMYTIPSFSNREKEVIRHLMLGKLNKEIACELNISLSAVKKHNKNIYRKTGVGKRVAVVLYLSNYLKA